MGNRLADEVYARWDPMGRPEKLSNPLLPEANRMLEVGRALIEDLGFERGNQVARLSEACTPCPSSWARVMTSSGLLR